MGNAEEGGCEGSEVKQEESWLAQWGCSECGTGGDPGFSLGTISWSWCLNLVWGHSSHGISIRTYLRKCQGLRGWTCVFCIQPCLPTCLPLWDGVLEGGDWGELEFLDSNWLVAPWSRLWHEVFGSNCYRPNSDDSVSSLVNQTVSYAWMQKVLPSPCPWNEGIKNNAH